MRRWQGHAGGRILSGACTARPECARVSDMDGCAVSLGQTGRRADPGDLRAHSRRAVVPVWAHGHTTPRGAEWVGLALTGLSSGGTGISGDVPRRARTVLGPFPGLSRISMLRKASDDSVEPAGRQSPVAGAGARVFGSGTRVRRSAYRGGVEVLDAESPAGSDLCTGDRDLAGWPLPQPKRDARAGRTAVGRPGVYPGVSHAARPVGTRQRPGAARGGGAARGRAAALDRWCGERPWFLRATPMAGATRRPAGGRSDRRSLRTRR
jgi:hypothetical protein